MRVSTRLGNGILSVDGRTIVEIRARLADVVHAVHDHAVCKWNRRIQKYPVASWFG